MKRFVILIAALWLLFLASPIFAEIEIGASLTPASYMKGEDAKDFEDFQDKEGSFLADMIFGFHFGYSWWWLFYASWDSYVMPPWWIMGQTGQYKPGFLNLIDLGVRPAIGPILIMAEVGVNHMYLHGQDDDPEVEGDVDFGANLRLGAGLKFGWWSLTASGTCVFVDFDTMTNTLQQLGEGGKRAEDATQKLLATLIPSLTFSIHL